MAKFVRETAPLGARLCVMGGSPEYWLHGYELRVGYPARLDDVRGCDYYVAAPWGQGVFDALGQSAGEFNRALDDPVLFTQLFNTGDGGYTIYAVNFK